MNWDTWMRLRAEKSPVTQALKRSSADVLGAGGAATQPAHRPDKEDFAHKMGAVLHGIPCPGFQILWIYFDHGGGPCRPRRGQVVGAAGFEPATFWSQPRRAF